jgi:hypothetical protein
VTRLAFVVATIGEVNADESDRAFGASKLGGARTAYTPIGRWDGKRR